MYLELIERSQAKFLSNDTSKRNSFMPDSKVVNMFTKFILKDLPMVILMNGEPAVIYVNAGVMKASISFQLSEDFT